MDGTQEQITARNIADAATATAKAVFEAAQAAATLIAKDNIITSNAIAVLQTEMAGLQNQQASFEAEMNRKMDLLDPKFEKVYAKLDQVMLGRPTWVISLAITALFSLSVGLIVYVVTHPIS
jgi:hypothetical protein